MKYSPHIALAAIIVAIPFAVFAISDGILGIGVLYQNDVHPDNLVYELKPGDTFQDEAIITHTGTQIAHVKLYAGDKVDEKNKNSNTQQFISKWVTLEKTSFDFAPSNNAEIIKFSIAVPPDAKMGEYRGMIYIHEPAGENDAPVDVNDGKGGVVRTRVGRRIALGIYLTVTNNPHMPTRTRKNPAEKIKYMELMIYFVIGSTFVLGGLLFLQEKRKIKTSKI